MNLCRKLQEYARRLIYHDGMTPVPISILVVVFTVTFFSGWITTMVFSFLPKLVQWFGIDELGTGYNVGITSTSIYIGAFISSSMWGYLSDKKGIRTCIIATSACCVITTLAFGCSTSLKWAIVTRFLQGCSVGQVVPLKGLLREVCDESNMALGMSVLLTAFSVGNIIGPSVGGFTAFPHKMYPRYFSKDGLFGKFPALLPNLIVATGIAIGIPLTLFLLPADSNRRMNIERSDIDQEERIALLCSESKSYGMTEVTVSTFSDTEREDATDTKIMCCRRVPFTSYISSRISTSIEQFITSDFLMLLRTREFSICCVVYMIFAIVEIGFEQMFPIIASTDPKYQGMGFEPSQVGTLLMIVSIVQIVFQLTILPRLSTYFGPQKILIISNIIQAILCPVLPAVALLKYKEMMWVGLIVVIFLVRICAFTGYLSLNILVNNTVDVAAIGCANGITMTVKYFGKLLAPITCGGIYSWSLVNIKGVPENVDPLGFPFDQFLTFFFLSFLSVLCIVFIILMPAQTSYVSR